MRENRAMTDHDLHLTGDADADHLLSISPLALVIGMVLDQQIPMEWAFRGPQELMNRLNRGLDAKDLAGMDPDALVKIFSTKPALHRYPGSMAARTQACCRAIVDDFEGDVASIWTGAADGKDLLKRVKSLPGFGDMKAKIFIALLAKQCGVVTPGWQVACEPYGEPGSFRSVADITDLDSLEKVRAYKASMKKNATPSAVEP